jgi:dipeptidyl aminopeptidase/acylaminoacyl peptidase
VKPKPKALVAYWGYGDVDGAWYVTPSEHYRKQPLVSKEEAYKAVGGKVLTGTEGDVGKARGRFYLYCRQNGLWTKEVTGFDPQKEHDKIDPYCPVRNLTANYPPILMIHGTNDTDVPHEESAAMDRELTRLKVPHDFISVPEGGHGLGGADPKLIRDANDRAAAFIRKHLK